MPNGYTVVVEPSIFRGRETFVLGHYRWRWCARLRAWWHVQVFPHAEAIVLRGRWVIDRRALSIVRAEG